MKRAEFTLASKTSSFTPTMPPSRVLWLEGPWHQAEDGGDFLLIFIDEGKLYMGVNLGSDVRLKPIGTNVIVADNHWHTVAMKRAEFTLASKTSSFIPTMPPSRVLWLEGPWHQAEDGGDFLLIFIDEGKLYMGVNLGSDVRLKPIGTNVTVADNHWHTVAVRRKERKCELWLDSKKLLAVVASPGDSSLDTDGLIHFGGANPKKQTILRALNLSNKFVGCVRNLSIFGKEVNILVDSLKSVETPKYCYN
uniref:LAM_G_DOMAIN domain-containing protein n=1 Tax=Caenorhabditis japonica TaxID=281687 RepID=A0A8R1I206_CAEJA